MDHPRRMICYFAAHPCRCKVTHREDIQTEVLLAHCHI
jgi:hypothetical protein